jgi:hypothetical protein
MMQHFLGGNCLSVVQQIPLFLWNQKVQYHEKYYLLSRHALLSVRYLSTFRRNVLCSSSGTNSRPKPSKELAINILAHSSAPKCR